MQEPERRQNLWDRVQQLGALLGVAVQSPVIALVVGDAATALAASAQLLKKGFHVPAIRPPTVPKNTSRSVHSLTFFILPPLLRPCQFGSSHFCYSQFA